MERPEHFPTDTVRIDPWRVVRASAVVMVDGRSERVRMLGVEYGTHWQYVGRMKDGRLVVGPPTALLIDTSSVCARTPHFESTDGKQVINRKST